MSRTSTVHYILNSVHIWNYILYTIPYRTVPYGKDYDTVPYNTVRYSTVRYSAVQYGTVRQSTVAALTVQYHRITKETSTHRGGKILEWSGSLGVGAGGDAGGVDGGEADDAFCDGVGDIRLSKKTGRGSDDWRMLLPLDPQGFIREAPRKLTTVNKN